MCGATHRVGPNESHEVVNKYMRISYANISTQFVAGTFQTRTSDV
jgi:hypothetical protein